MSFLPIIIILMIAYAIVGTYPVSVSKLYGMDAFIEAFGWLCILFIYFIPVLPIMLIYQTIYLSRIIIKRNIKVAKTFFKLSFLPIITLMLVSICCAIFGFNNYSGYGNNSVGIETIIQAFCINAWTLIWRFTINPLLPVMLMYQITYIIIAINNRKKEKNIYKK